MLQRKKSRPSSPFPCNDLYPRPLIEINYRPSQEKRGVPIEILGGKNIAYPRLGNEGGIIVEAFFSNGNHFPTSGEAHG